MENKDISQIALEKIKETGIKPMSKNFCMLKRFYFWIFVFLSIAIGSVSFAVTLLLLVNNDWMLFNKFGFNFVLKTLPYFWIFCLLLFAVLGKYYYRKTSLGHRKNLVLVIGLYTAITIIFGSIIYSFGIGEVIEQSFYNNITVYRGAMFDREKFWNLHDQGLLSGVILNIDNKSLEIRDRDGFVWKVDTGDAFFGRNVDVVPCGRLRIIGNKIDEKIFDAEKVMPWMGRGLGLTERENCMMGN